MIDDADEISLLDVLVFFAENWLLLILMPALVAAGAYMWAGTLPPTYKATVSITVPEMDVQGAPPIDTRSFYRAVLAPREGVEAVISSSGVTITAEHGDAERASEMAIAVHSEAINALIVEFEQHLNIAEAIIAELDPLLNQIRDNIGDDPTQVLALVQILDALGPLQARVSKAALGIETLQTKPAIQTLRQGPHPALIGLFAGAGVGALLLAFMLTRKRLFYAAGTEDGRRKLQRIRTAFFLRRSRASGEFTTP